ncbi:DNA repair protein RecO [Terriglobus sp. RCC_193]|uniref:DNA repair protein RecO n=1 Tax=Terriglobus sp. RCC_193 TaxID=3239218 RepID=UPI0035236309
MPTAHQSEAIVLRTWPFAEADLMVAFFTREQGVVRGVARHAMKSRRRFGGALEPMTQVQAAWVDRPKQDVVRLERLEIVWSPLREPVDYTRAAGLAFLAEILEGALPDHAPEDDVFRLATSVAPMLRRGTTAVSATYFALWITRLLGWMPDLGRCSVSEEVLRNRVVYYSPLRDGVFSEGKRPQGSMVLPAEAIAAAARIFREPLPQLIEEGGLSRAALQQLRRFAVSTLERHLEERLKSARVLATL